MYTDKKQEIEKFYKSALGEIISKRLILTINQVLGDVSGQKILVVGPKIKGMQRIEDECNEIQYKTIKGTSVFPFSDDSFDKVIVLHSLEFSEHIKGFLREVWRVTAPQGSAIFVIPNRLGLLTRSDITPFGYGQPFTRKQFKRLLFDNLFSGQKTSEALCMPVWALSQRPSVVTFMDEAGKLLWPQLCGAFVVAASKTVYALEPDSEKAKAALAPVIAPY